MVDGIGWRVDSRHKTRKKRAHLGNEGTDAYYLEIGWVTGPQRDHIFPMIARMHNNEHMLTSLDG